MRIAISGSSGFIGAPLAAHLQAMDTTVIRLVRTREQACEANTAFWDPDSGELDTHKLENLDAVVHLAGKNVAARRWTKKFCQQLRDSRVGATAELAQQLSPLAQPPKTFISASAIGYYGDSGEVIVDETAPQGEGFLASLAADWEKASHSLKETGCRIVAGRIGMTLHSKGGALGKMLTPFRFGLGGCLGNGRQWISWIARDDLVRAITHILGEPALDGPVNLVAPAPVTNSDFTRALGRAIHRPTILPVPAVVVRTLFGQMGEELLLRSTRVSPRKLLGSGFSFTDSTIEEALEGFFR